jgi:class 3 adenylate cyclase
MSKLPDFSKIVDLAKLQEVAKRARPFPPFGKLLHDHRTLRGMSVEEVARAVQMAPSALREIEQGTRAAPPKQFAKALANTLELRGESRDTFLESAEWESTVLSNVLMREDEKTQADLPALRASILAFLIADIRGYSHFTLEHGDRAAAELTTRFAEIARSVAERWDGRVVEVRGDEILAIFGSARQALLAAHDLNARCDDATRARPDQPLTIGIGLDVGEAVPVEGGGYRGAALNRAARLCALAGAGEVLVSSGMVYIAPDPEGVAFVPRGQAQLKGFEEPTPILLAAPVVPAEVIETTEDDARADASKAADTLAGEDTE